MEEEKDRWPMVRKAIVVALVFMFGAILLDVLGYLPV